MASRSHVDVGERRLRPIYDCLDNGNNKKAILEADKVLKKQRDFQCAKILKALALLRLGRHDESAIILREVHLQHPTDEATLQAMAICYREVHKLELIAEVYENAHKAKPDNEDILSALFMSQVRLGDYKKQQQTAMSLHKLRPQKNPYYFWAIMSIVMQAHFSPDKKLAMKMFLPLAERMTQKYVDDNKIEAEAEVRLYLIITELLEKWDDALKLLQGSLGDKIVSEINFKETKQAELNLKLSRWHKANATYRKLLVENPDHWQFWMSYLDSWDKLVDEQWTPDKEEGEEIIDYSEDKALEFVQETIHHFENSRKLRGPYLAQMELLRKLKNRNSPKAESLGGALSLLVQYFEMFGDKYCCFTDIKQFLDLLDENEQTKFVDLTLENVQLEVSEESITYPENPKQMQRHLTALQCTRFLGFHNKLSNEEKVNLSKEFLDRYLTGLKFGTELLSTDLQYSDNYLLMAVHLLLDIFQVTDHAPLIWQCIALLEMGIKSSPSNFQFKLLIIRLYCQMGAFGPCPALYDSMEIKHIMNDTLGHIVSNHVARLGHFVAACAMYGTMLRFFTVNHKETTEYLIAAYKYGSFEKVYEFVKFREKLQNSLQYASATAERLLLDLILETNNHNSTEQLINYMEIDPEKDKTDFADLCDNRDFSVILNWDPPSTRLDLENVKEKFFMEEKAWLKLRNTVLRILAAATMINKLPENQENNFHANNGIGDDRKPMPEVMQDLLEQFRSHIDEKCRILCESQQKCSIYGPYRTRLGTYLGLKMDEVFAKMAENVLYVHKLEEDGFDKVTEEDETKLVSGVVTELEELVSRCKGNLLDSNNDKKEINPLVIENLVMASEALSHATILCGVCHRILKPIKTGWSRKMKKKKQSAPPLPETFKSFNTLISGLEKVGQSLMKAVMEIDPIFLSIDLSNMNLSEPFCDNEELASIEKEVWKKVEKSYQQSAKEITDMLHNKLQYLNSIHL